MEKLIIEPGIKTPHINFSPENGVLEIKGKSIPENSIEFYRPVYAWLDEYGRQPKNKTNIIIQLEYFNTSSSKCLLDIFRKLEPLQKNSSSEVSVTWLYEEDDEDMMEAGEDYQSIVKLPFVISKI
jgi:SiaC family regulatory phosphoprotein